MTAFGGTVSDNPSVSTKLALDRTRLAYERTLMAWVRTATSLISFGFTIYKFFQFLRDGQAPSREGAVGLRGFAMMMIGIGLTALLLATVDHRRYTRQLQAEFGPQPYSLAAFVAALVGVLGVLGLLSVLLRF
jgi:putative membrane protein